MDFTKTVLKNLLLCNLLFCYWSIVFGLWWTTNKMYLIPMLWLAEKIVLKWGHKVWAPAFCMHRNRNFYRRINYRRKLKLDQKRQQSAKNITYIILIILPFNFTPMCLKVEVGIFTALCTSPFMYSLYIALIANTEKVYFPYRKKVIYSGFSGNMLCSHCNNLSVKAIYSCQFYDQK